MHRFTSLRTVCFFFALVSLAGLGLADPAKADSVTDTFDLKLTIKQWCRGNPKFFESLTVTIDPRHSSTNTKLILTRDDSNPTEIQARLDTHGKNADLDAIVLAGKAYFSNKAQSRAEFALSGVNPSNAGHFLTLRGQATLDKFGNPSTLTGTLMLQVSNTYTITKTPPVQSQPVDCFASGTFGTSKRLAGGTLTVENAPASVEGTFVADPRLTHKQKQFGIGLVEWAELSSQGGIYDEEVGVIVDPITGALYFAGLFVSDSGVENIWGCSALPLPDFHFPSCNGASVNRNSGKVSFSGTVLTESGAAVPAITLNGTLTFSPF